MTPHVADGALRISVVIPVKNDGELLRRCLAALATQTRFADEIIVVDNASEDASARIASEAGAKVVRCQERGIPAASSRGYDASTGDVILRLDADCIPGDRWVESLERAFMGRPDVDAFTGGAIFIDGPGILRGPLARVYLSAYSLFSATALGGRT